MVTTAMLCLSDVRAPRARGTGLSRDAGWRTALVPVAHPARSRGTAGARRWSGTRSRPGEPGRCDECTGQPAAGAARDPVRASRQPTSTGASTSAGDGAG